MLSKWNWNGNQKTFELYQKAANLENADGIYNLGNCYENGIGTSINKQKAFELYQKSANLGSASGTISLGYCYQNGVGIRNLGNISGINNLGDCYKNGIGTSINCQKAFYLYQKAANLENANGIIQSCRNV